MSTKKPLPANRIAKYYDPLNGHRLESLPPLDSSGPRYPVESWRRTANDSRAHDAPLSHKVFFVAMSVALVAVLIWMGSAG